MNDEQRAAMLEIRSCPECQTHEETIAHLEAEVGRLNTIWREPASTFTSADLWRNHGAPARFKIAAGVAVGRANVALYEAKAAKAREDLEVLRRRDDVGREAQAVAETHAAMAAVQADLDRAKGDWLSARARLDLAEMRAKMAADAVTNAEAAARRWRDQVQRDEVLRDEADAHARLAGVA